MSKTPWTPGPWEVLPLQDGRRAIYTDAEMGFIGDVFGWEEDDPEQAEANARLIAAAPEMAEVLECLEPAVIYDDETGNVWIRPAAEFDDGRFTPREYEA